MNTPCPTPSPESSSGWNDAVETWLPTVGEVYCVSTARLSIVQVLEAGIHTEWRVLPDCIRYRVIGTRTLGGKYWAADYWQPYEGKADKHYFFPWDRKGILFGTPKARDAARLLDLEREAITQVSSTAKDSQDSLKFRRLAEAHFTALEALCQTWADLARFPLPPPQQTTDAQRASSPWSIL